jgi:hypothetical protein
MRKSIFILVILFSGCSHFQYYDAWKECDKLATEGEQHLITAVHLIDSLNTRCGSLETKCDSLQVELDRCQQ